MGKTTIQTDNAPAAVGPYSQAVATDNLVFVSGQLGMKPGTADLVPGGVVEQTKQVLENLKAVLKAADCTPDDVVKATCYLADINDFAAMNEVYGQVFNGPDYPARAAFQVAALPKGALVEIEAIAVRR